MPPAGGANAMRNILGAVYREECHSLEKNSLLLTTVHRLRRGGRPGQRSKEKKNFILRERPAEKNRALGMLRIRL